MVKINPIVSIIMPCLNEEGSVGRCVESAIGAFKIKNQKSKIKNTIKNSKLLEVLVVDNGSEDKSMEVAEKSGARVVIEKKKGYGNALMRGIREAKGEIVVMGDSDGTYDFNELGNLIAPFLNIGISVLKGGNVKCQMANVKTKACLADYSRGAPDIIIGSRLCGKIEKGAMPFLNRYLGTPVLNFFLRLFFGIHLSDSQSGFRAFRKEAIKRLNLKSGGMEFASEMLVSARQNNLLISEVPVTYRKRIGKSKLSPIRDAWRHVRFMLFFSPTYLFLIPGGTICLIGLIGLIRLSLGPMYIGRGYLDIHTMMVSSFVATLGFQIFFLGLFAKVYAYLYLNQRDKIIEWLLRQFTLERGLLVGGIIVFWGMMGFLGVLKVWIGGGFGELSAARPVLLAITMLSLGVQAIFGSFLFALLGSRWER